MKTRRYSWTLAILATGLLLGYVAADLLQLPPLHAGAKSSTAGGLPEAMARINALEQRGDGWDEDFDKTELLVDEVQEMLDGALAIVEPMERTPEGGLEINTDVEIQGGLVAGELGGPELAVGPDAIRMSEGLTEATLDESGLVLGRDGTRAVELLVHENPFARFNTALVVQPQESETGVQTTFEVASDRAIIAVLTPNPEDPFPLAELKLDALGLDASVHGDLTSANLRLGEDEFNAIIQPMQSPDPLAEIRLDPTRAIIAILREAGVMLDAGLLLDGVQQKVTIQAGDQVGVEAPITAIDSEKGILAPDTNASFFDVFAHSVHTEE